MCKNLDFFHFKLKLFFNRKILKGFEIAKTTTKKSLNFEKQIFTDYDESNNVFSL